MQKVLLTGFLTAMVFAMPTFAQDALKLAPEGEIASAEMERVYAKVESNPEMAPFWYCFNQGLNMSVGQVAEKSKDQPDYYFKLLMLGGFSAIGDRVRNACNQSLEDKGISRANSDAGKRINQLFIALLIREDVRLYESCEKKPLTEEWRAAKAYCSTQKMKFEKKLESLL